MCPISETKDISAITTAENFQINDVCVTLELNDAIVLSNQWRHVFNY